MSGAARPDCRTTQRLASPYLDGRLPARSRRLVQEHLFGCNACVLEFQQLRRLSEAARALPVPAATVDLAARVRETVTARRQGILTSLGRRRWRLAAAATAAVLLSGSAWFVGYRMGKSGAEGPAADTPLAEAPRVIHDEDVDTAGFERAAHGLVSDIELIEDVAPSRRRPLVTAQIELFDLDGWAGRVLRRERGDERLAELAGFVHRVSDMMHEAGPPDWRSLRDEVRASRLIPRTLARSTGLRRRAPACDHDRLQAVVAEAAGELDAFDRSSLFRLLRLKDDFVHGRVDDSLAQELLGQVMAEMSRGTDASLR